MRKLKDDFTSLFLPTGLLPSLNLLKPARCCSLPSMQCSTKAQKNCTQLSLLPGNQSSYSAEPEPDTVLFWQRQPSAHLTYRVLARIGSHHAGGREWAFVWSLQFSFSKKRPKYRIPFFGGGVSTIQVSVKVPETQISSPLKQTITLHIFMSCLPICWYHGLTAFSEVYFDTHSPSRDDSVATQGTKWPQPSSSDWFRLGMNTFLDIINHL